MAIEEGDFVGTPDDVIVIDAGPSVAEAFESSAGAQLDELAPIDEPEVVEVPPVEEHVAAEPEDLPQIETMHISEPNTEKVAEDDASFRTGDEDFGEFGEFEEFTDMEPVPMLVEPEEPAHSKPNTNGPVPLVSTAVYYLSDDDIRRNLTQPASHDAGDSSDDPYFVNGDTATSQQLWQHLTETSYTPLPRWDGSPIHRQLALCLGVPLNLDKSLPKAATRKMDLPTQQLNEESEGMQHLPNWSLLSVVSKEALEHMSDDEMVAHLAELESVLERARELKDSMESREMDLMGEKNILEGMVESLLVFSQRNQRERLKRKVSKSRRQREN